MFELGNHASKGLSPLKSSMARLSTGAIGALAQHNLSHYVATGELLKEEQMLNVALSGATMNLVLPKINEKLFSLQKGKIEAQAETSHQANRSNERLLIASPEASEPSLGLAADFKRSKGVLQGLMEEAPFENYDDFLERGQFLRLIEFEGYYNENGRSIVMIPKASPNYDRPCINTVNLELGKLPDPCLVGELYLVDHEHPLSPWLQQKSSEIICAEAGDFGELTFFRANKDSFPRSLAHEWGHLLLKKYSYESKLFELASCLEPLRIESKSVAHHYNSVEPFGIMSETFLLQPEYISFETAISNPLKTAIFARTLQGHLNEIEPQFRTCNHQKYLELTLLLDAASTHFAIEALNNSTHPRKFELLQYLQSTKPSSQ
ncbi:MAG: hypothetical protein K2X27_11170 [Candidatus Obscuribacterales bacterium]|nr:hypothetical protein [Candidatus Obscuribacterales bacterium]